MSFAVTFLSSQKWYFPYQQVIVKMHLKKNKTKKTLKNVGRQGDIKCDRTTAASYAKTISKTI